MKDFFYDLVYNWKHGLSRENTKGSRGLLWFVIITCGFLMVLGIVSMIVAIVTHTVKPVLAGLFTLGVGIAFFTFVSTR